MSLAKRLTTLLVTLSLIALCTSAQAFYPETEVLAEKLQEQVGSVETLQIEITLAEAPRLTISVWKNGPDWRQEWILRKRSGDLRVAAAALGRGRDLIDVYPDRDRFPLPFVAFWHQKPAIEWFDRLGLDTEVKSYQFVSGQPCIVLGAEYKQWHSPQLWIHNEHWYPVRLFTQRGMIWHWKEYRSVGNHLVPHSLEVTFPDGRMVRMTLQWRGINRQIPERLFDGSAFERKFGQAGWSHPDIDLFDFLMANLPPARAPGLSSN